jgi:hypothetical protein
MVMIERDMASMNATTPAEFLAKAKVAQDFANGEPRLDGGQDASRDVLSSLVADLERLAR